jgi:hypothetical protein
MKQHHWTPLSRPRAGGEDKEEEKERKIFAD